MLDILERIKQSKEFEVDFEAIEFTEDDIEVFEHMIRLLDNVQKEKITNHDVIIKIGDIQIMKSISNNENKTFKYEQKVNELCNNRLIGFKSKKEDAQLINKIIQTLAGEDNLSISNAQSILSDVQTILPMLATI